VKDNRVLVDTSMWIAYFKDTDPVLTGKIDGLLTSSDVYTPRVVIAELIKGAKTKKEISVIEDFVEAFHIIDQTENTWLRAGRLSFSIKRKGMTVNIVDCYIAAIAHENNCKIMTLDEHFKGIKKYIPLELLQ
jgi:tRNA(fMet)-specific endonuclease VapC